MYIMWENFEYHQINLITKYVILQVRTTSPFQLILLTETDYIVPFNE